MAAATKTVTKALFIETAKALAATKPVRTAEQRYWQWRRDTDAIAELFAHNNARFDSSRFLRACGREDV